MNRLLSEIKLDFTLQVRNHLYTIGIAVAVMIAAGFAWLAKPEQMVSLVPTLLLLITGAMSMLYVGAMILFEMDEGTLSATIVTPVRTWEYLTSKIVSLTILSTVESTIFVGLTILFFKLFKTMEIPNLGLILIGLILLGLMYVLAGIILMVRYDKITDFLFPMAGVAVLFQFPFLHFWGVIEHPLFLIIPTTAPTMIFRAAFVPIAGWEWAYAIAYSLLWCIGLLVWAFAAYRKHILGKAG